MISNNPVEPQASPSGAKAGTVVAGTPVLDPHDGIEVASGGSSPINDPSGQDHKPPGAEGCDFDLLA